MACLFLYCIIIPARFSGRMLLYLVEINREENQNRDNFKGDSPFDRIQCFRPVLLTLRFVYFGNLKLKTNREFREVVLQ